MTVAQRRSRVGYDHLAPLFRSLTDSSLPSERRAELRERLVTEHLPVAEHIARRFRSRGQSEEDLRQVAALGLVRAVDRFDPNRGTDFLSFAVPTITGEVRRFFRDATWSVRVPRRLKELHAELGTATAELSQELGRAPRPSELASRLGCSVTEVREGLSAANAYQSDSLDQLVSTEDGTAGGLGDLVGVDDPDLATAEARQVLHPALSALPERERTIVILRFYGNLTQTQIAERVHLSQMHVSRLLASSLATLRRAIAD